VPGERGPRAYRKLRDAVRQANASNTDRPIRVGLAVLVTNASAVTETTFLPCPNMAAAARQINQLTARREASSQSDSDRTFCGIVAYRGSWERPNTAFARAVRATVANDDAPNFDMPKETGIEAGSTSFIALAQTELRVSRERYVEMTRSRSSPR
jgi:hypothetical protein